MAQSYCKVSSQGNIYYYRNANDDANYYVNVILNLV